MATTQPSVRVLKTFPYRGDPAQQFSNRYYFDGSTPADSDAWHALFDGIVGNEKTLYPSSVTITECHGYAPGSEVAVASKLYTQAGTHVEAGAAVMPGDCAAVLRMATTKRSTKNHTVYVFSYYHSAERLTGAASPDDLAAGQKSAIETYGNLWLNGMTIGARTLKRTTPDGHLVTGRAVDPYIGHRDFPR